MIASIAALILFSAVPVTAGMSGGVPAQAGSVCTFGPYKWGAVGAVIAEESDSVGPSGNEVKDIDRVFFVTSDPGSTPTSGFAGYLSSTFDGRHYYTPAMLQRETPPTMIGTVSLPVTPQDFTQLPLTAWLTRIALESHEPVTAQLRPLLTAKNVATSLSPCFSRPWDGKT